MRARREHMNVPPHFKFRGKASSYLCHNDTHISCGFGRCVWACIEDLGFVTKHVTTHTDDGGAERAVIKQSVADINHPESETVSLRNSG